MLTFYPDLRSITPGRVRVRVCRGEACRSVGAHALADHVTGSLGFGFGGTTEWATSCPEYEVTAVQVLPTPQAPVSDQPLRGKVADPG